MFVCSSENNPFKNACSNKLPKSWFHRKTLNKENVFHPISSHVPAVIILIFPKYCQSA